jgi:hypothetical protein
LLKKAPAALFLPGALFLLLAATASAQDAQTPVFRSGVELLEVDVNVVDANSRPIADLRSTEFAVSVDGKSRKVVSSEFIRDDSAQPGAAFKEDPYVATNTDHRADASSSSSSIKTTSPPAVRGM